MGIKHSKKNHVVKIDKNVSNDKIDNHIISPPMTNEPVISMTKRASATGYCGFNNGCICSVNFDMSRISMSVSAHDKEVTKMKYLTKSCLLCTTSRDKSIKLWSQIDEGGLDEEMRCEYHQPNAHDLIISGMDISIDETAILTGSRDNTIKLWDVPKFTVKAVSKISRNLVTSVKFSPYNSFIVATGEDKIVRILDPVSLDMTIEFPKKNHIQTDCDISTDENYVLSASNGFNGSGCEVTIWDLRMKKILCELKGHQSTVSCCIFLPVEWFGSSNQIPYKIASCSRDSTVILWDISELQNTSILSSYYLPGSGNMTSILPLDNHKLAVSTYSAGIVLLEYNTTCGSFYHVGSI